MRFLREMPLNRVTPEQIAELLATGYKLIYKEDSIEIWADVTPDASDGE
jgi:hypothetical protein